MSEKTTGHHPSEHVTYWHIGDPQLVALRCHLDDSEYAPHEWQGARGASSVNELIAARAPSVTPAPSPPIIRDLDSIPALAAQPDHTDSIPLDSAALLLGKREGPTSPTLLQGDSILYFLRLGCVA